MGQIVLNIRGTNGSGKSFIVGEIIRRFKGMPLYDSNGRIIGYQIGRNVRAIGAYKSTVTCGGCDTVRNDGEKKSQDVICDRVAEWVSQGSSVLFEGLIVSSVLERYYELALRLRPKADWIWGFLNTPTEMCIQRVLQRNGGNSFKTKNLTDKVRTIERTINKLIAREEKVMMIDSMMGADQVEGILKGELQ